MYVQRRLRGACVLANKEVFISMSTENSPVEWAGSQQSSIYLASPLKAAVSVLSGTIVAADEWVERAAVA